MKIDFKSIAKVIDHTLLQADATEEDITRLCEEGKQYGFAAVCIPPVFVPLAVQLVKGSDVSVCTVAGFPLGFYPAAIKVKEAELAVMEGAREIDMVIQVGALKSGKTDFVLSDIQKVVQVCHPKNAIVKVIIETGLLSDPEKETACRLVAEAGAEYVKTSTGTGTGGATVENIRLMKNALRGSTVKIKASGGIRTYNQAVKMLKAGADRIGTSSGVQIIKQVKSD